jgi:hypothetical protein
MFRIGFESASVVNGVRPLLHAESLKCPAGAGGDQDDAALLKTNRSTLDFFNTISGR